MSDVCSALPVFTGVPLLHDTRAAATSPMCLAPWSLRSLPWTGIAAPPHVAALPSAMEPDVSFLFRMCLAPEQGLDRQSYAQASAALGVDVAVIEAVAEVETSGKAFDDEGRPRILFERHYFHRLTHGRYDHAHPDISNALRGGYGKFSAQYKKLEKAYRLAPTAALQSASWGRFQIMGKNFHAAGFPSVQWFVLSLSRSEANHLQAFANFVKSDKAMLEALRKKHWASFAKRYNGSGYRENDYDGKLERAYKRLSGAR